ncbi:MAG: GGDEF and EAL domain-containing protein [Gemmatimonadota bacterium]
MQHTTRFEYVEGPQSGPEGVPPVGRISDRVALELLRQALQLPSDFEALGPALAACVSEVCRATGWLAGHAWVRKGRTADYESRAWHAASEPLSALEKVCRSSKGDFVGDLLNSSDALGQVLILGQGYPDSPAWLDTALQSGSACAYAVPVLAERDAAALLVFFAADGGDSRRASDVLKAFGNSLGLIAGRERMKRAVGSAAKHARSQADQIDDLHMKLADHASQSAWLEKATASGIWEWDLSSDRFECSAGWRELLGLSGKPLTSDPFEWLDRIHPLDRERVEVELEEALRQDDSSFYSLHRLRHADDGYRSVLVHGLGLRDSDGKVTHILGVITASGAEGIETTPGMYDASTGLPTRALLADRIGQAVRRRTRSPENTFAVLMVSAIPQGSDAPATEVLAEIRAALARRLTLAVRPADTVAHARRGEFGMLLDGIPSLEDAREIVRRIHTAVQPPFPFEDSEVRVRTHVGIVLGRSSHDDAESLLKDASVAMRQAETRNADFRVFDFAAQDYADRVYQLETDLRRAIDLGELFFEYLPIVALDSGRLTGLEALMRWKHPEKGLIPPRVFVPVVMASPLIHDVALWAVETACLQLKRWQERISDASPPPIAINITARQLFHEAFPGNVRSIMKRHGVEGRWLRFDISESELMQDAARAAEVLTGLRASQIEVYIDDFGTGYSSLSQLQYFPAAALKIDRQFVSTQRDRPDWGVARTIVELSRVLGMQVIAEGIETRKQFLELRDMGCQQGQGFLFSGPVGAAQAEDLIRDGYPLDLEAMRLGRSK